MLFKSNIIFFSLFIFLLKKISNQMNKRRLKGIYDYYEKLKICSKASQNLLNYFEGGNYTVYSYKFYDNKTYIKSLIDFIDNNDEENKIPFKKYIFHLSKYIIFICIGLISFILFFILLFISKQNINNKQLFFFLIIINSFFFSLIIIICFISLSTISKLKFSINTSSCTLIKFIEEILSGQSEKIPNRFLGIIRSIEILNNVKRIINIIKNNTDNFFNNQTSLITSYQIFIGTMMEEYKRIYNESTNTYTTEAILNFPPEGSFSMLGRNNTHSFIFDYIKNYGPYDKNNTELNYVFNILYNGLNKANESLFLFTRDIYIASSDEIQEILNFTLSDIDNLLESLESFYDKIIDRWFFYHEIFENFGLSSLYICYIILIFFSFFIPLIRFIIIFNKKIRKYKNHFQKTILVFLFFFNFIVFFSYIIGSFIGIIGSIGTDLMDVIHYTISYENLMSEKPKIIKTSRGIQYASICIEGNGDLKNIFNLDSEYAKVFDEMILMEELFKNTTKYILNNYNETTLNIFKTNLTDLQNNFLKSNITDLTINNSIQINNLYNNFNKYTMRGYYQDCIDEKWVTKPLSDGKYIYYGNNENTPSPRENKSVALFLEEWNTISSVLRYINLIFSCPIRNQIYNTIPEAALYYVDNLNFLKTANYETIKVMIELEKLVQESFFNLIHDFYNSLISSIELIHLWNDIYHNITYDNNDLFSFVNCHFVKPNLKIVYSEFKEIFGKNFKNSSLLIEMTAFIGSLCLFTSFFILDLDLIFQKQIKKIILVGRNNSVNSPKCQLQPSIFIDNYVKPNQNLKKKVMSFDKNNNNKNNSSNYTSSNLLIFNDNKHLIHLNKNSHK